MAPKDFAADLSVELADRFITTGGPAASEVVAYDRFRYFVTNAAAERIDVFRAGGEFVGFVPLGELPGFGGVTSIAAKGGVVAVTIDGAEIGGVPQRGYLAVFDAETLQILNYVSVGFLPDHLAFSLDGSEIYVANEGEPRPGGDPRGSVSIVTFPEGFNRLAEVTEVDFRAFDGEEEALRAEGVRIFPGVSASRDFEPEYISVDPLTGDILVSLQEANTVARIDRATLGIELLPKGVVNHAELGNGIDASDRDGQIRIANWPVFGLRMADAIAAFEIDGVSYYATANEGDARDEDARVKDLSLDPTAFPLAEFLQRDEFLGRLTVSTIDGDVDGDGDFDQLFAYGSRSFTIFDAEGRVVFDSADQFERIIAEIAPERFNSDSPDGVENRSDNKGPEPEGIAVGQVDGRTLAVIGLERDSGLMIYDITNPVEAQFLAYVDGVAQGDVSPEVVIFIPGGESPTGFAQIAVAYEVSGTTVVYDLTFTGEPVGEGEPGGGGPVEPALFDLRVTEMWPGQDGADLTADWFEITNRGAEAWVAALHGGLFYDDDSADPAAAAPIVGIDRIEPGESVIVVIDEAEAATARFVEVWGAVVDLDEVRIGITDGAGLGQGGDAVTLFVGGPTADSITDAQGYPDAGGANSGRSWDVDLAAFSEVANASGAVATIDTAGESGDEPAVGSPGFALDFETPARFTLQLFHLSDQEANATSVRLAPNLSAIHNVLSAQDIDGDGLPGYDHTLFLSSGDAWIPGLFYNASDEIYGVKGAADILIQNALGVQTISFGNHEFDQGTRIISQLIGGLPPSDEFEPFDGASFPYLSGNLDFSADPNLAPLATEDGQDVADIAGRIAGAAVVTTDGGERIGLVSATTPTLATISSPGAGVGILPESFDRSPTPEQLDALAAVIQADVDALLAANPDIDKVILLSHMQVLEIEFALAERLTGVDIVIAGGSNRRLFDDNDIGFGGDAAQGVYPTFLTAADGNPVAVVNTDAAYRYLGRLVIDFDENGVIVPESYDPTISGAYASDDAGVARVGAEGLASSEVVAIANAVNEVIVAGESNFFGVTTVFLNGQRQGGGLDGVRTQETNLGNLTADANLFYARDFDDTVLVSIKNGGGIRASIGSIVVPGGGTEPVRLPPEGVPGAKPEGGISENDIANALSFNNGLTLLSLTTPELAAVLEHIVSGFTSLEVDSQMGHVGGVRFSFDPSLPPGARVLNAGVFDGEELVAKIFENGEIVDNGAQTFRTVTLNFLANGGSGYPFTDLENPNRVDIYQDLDGDNVADTDGPATGGATFAPDGTEQDALAEHLLARYGNDPTAEGFRTFDEEDTTPEFDSRIQNLAFRADAVFGETMTATAIYDIQGRGHVSPLLGRVATTTGVVTWVVSNGFYLQDPDGDGDDATSDALFVFTGTRGEKPAVGDRLTIEGEVGEFMPGGAATRNLSTTQLSNATFTVEETGVDLPAPVVIGAAGRLPPTEAISSGPLGEPFAPETDGIDFFESIEGMLVTVAEPLVVAATNRFGEVFTVVDRGVGASGLNDRGALTIAPDDFNPEKVQIQFGGPFPSQAIGAGAVLADVTGVLSYAFGNFEVLPVAPVVVIEETALAPTITTLDGDPERLTVATYNVLNLDPNDADGDTDLADGRFDAIARHIAVNLGAPDVVALQEVQDDSGSSDDGVVSAALTLQTLADAIAAAGGPAYAVLDNPFIGNNTSGGQPGGNIRNAYLFNPERVAFVEGSLATVGGQGDGDPFDGARLPLIATFEFAGDTVTLVNNHFSSKGGSAAILGVEQPFDQRQEDPMVNGGVDDRRMQAEAVRGFVDGLLAADPAANVVVLGDLNEFEFVSPVTSMTESLVNLVETLPRDERYSFNFQGNAQVLDHILVTEALAESAAFEFVRVNSEFVETTQRGSDHDPAIASLSLGGSSDDPSDGATLTVIASGTGDETRAPIFGVIVDGVSLGFRTIEKLQTNAERRANGRDYDSFEFDLPDAPTSSVSIVFANDRGARCGLEDVNLFVDGIIIGDRKFESEVDGFFIGDNIAAPERNGPREALWWNGELRFDDIGDLLMA